MGYAKVVEPGTFVVENHYYPQVRQAVLHPTVVDFFTLTQTQIIDHYCNLHSQIDRKHLQRLLSYVPRYLLWGGVDIFYSMDADRNYKAAILETNSCPSGQKSMPLIHKDNPQSGYKKIIENVFLPRLSSSALPDGGLAVFYDKNPMEVSGYAAALADSTQEPVYLVQVHHDEADPSIKFVNGVLYVRDLFDRWNPIRAAFRYLTQHPWNMIPIYTKTLVINPILGCLGGGRNKQLAFDAYSNFNADWADTHLQIHCPSTVVRVKKDKVPAWVKRFHGRAVIKDPYSNCGQGVFPIMSKGELNEFMNKRDFVYDHFIVQSLIGHIDWDKRKEKNSLYHRGTVPDAKGTSYIYDLRMVVGSSPHGLLPITMYARRARKPLTSSLPARGAAREVLLTNLSVKGESGAWDTDSERLIPMDVEGFNSLGLDLNSLIDGFIQACMTVNAIDGMSACLNEDVRYFGANAADFLRNEYVALDRMAA